MGRRTQQYKSYLMRSAIWYHLHNLKNVKNTDEGVLILVKLQAKVCNVSKRNTSPFKIVQMTPNRENYFIFMHFFIQLIQLIHRFIQLIHCR